MSLSARAFGVLCLAGVLSLASSCAANITEVGSTRAAQHSTAPSAIVTMQPVSYSEVTAISGYLIFNSHSRQLWDNEVAFNENDTPKCVTLINTYPFEADLRSSNSSFVEIEGFPVEDVLSGQVDVGACNRVGFFVKGVRLVGR